MNLIITNYHDTWHSLDCNIAGLDCSCASDCVMIVMFSNTALFPIIFAFRNFPLLEMFSFPSVSFRCSLILVTRARPGRGLRNEWLGSTRHHPGGVLRAFTAVS